MATASPRQSPPPTPMEAADSVDNISGRKRSHEEMFEEVVGPKSKSEAAQPEVVSGKPAPEQGTGSSLQTQEATERPLQQDRTSNEQIINMDPPFNPKQEIADLDWEEFEARYLKAMAEQDEAQKAIHDEFRRMMGFFGIWAQSAILHENDRAHKRLKTRVHYVQRAEGKLVEKRDHYTKVVKAFESALALLSGS